MNIIEKSFKELFPDREFNYSTIVKYTDRFKPYNANIRLSKNTLTLNLSKKWRTVDIDIKMGLVQELLLKILKLKHKNTKNIEMYNSFIKSLHNFVPKVHSEPILEKSFERVNNRYFHGILERPNLRLGVRSFHKLGSYEYASDTVTISKALISDYELIDYVMYHELLHKKHQFKTKNGKNYHHTTEFKKKEKEFHNADLMEKRLRRLSIKNSFVFWR